MLLNYIKVLSVIPQLVTIPNIKELLIDLKQGVYKVILNFRILSIKFLNLYQN